MQVPFPLRSNPTAFRFSGDTRVINMFPEEIGVENRAPVQFLSIPGQSAFSTPVADPCRGMISVPETGNIYSLHLSSLYKVNSAGTASRISVTVPGSSPAYMARNSATNPEIAIVSAGAGYIFDTNAETIQLLTLLDEPNSVTVLDGYFIFTFEDGRFQISGINDGTSVDALDFATAEAKPDKLLRAFADRSELWLFGSEAIEIWTNTGASDFPFERLGGTFIDKGCGSPLSVASSDNAVHWVGNDGVVYRGAGYSPQRVSTHAVERAISDLSDMTTIKGYAYNERGHAFYVLTCDEWTWVFDQATKVWHERKTYNHDDWAAWPYVRAFSKHIVGDKHSGALRTLENDVYTEAGEVIRCEIITPDMTAYPDKLAFHQLDVETNPAASLTETPQLMMQYSDDGGYTWSSERWAGTGAKGEYGALTRFTRLGTSGRGGRRFKFAMTDNAAKSFLLADVKAEAVRA